MIKRMATPIEGCCSYCGRKTVLRYEVPMKKTTLHICTLCYEEQMEWKNE